MKKLILMSLLIAFSFSVNANELKIGNTGLVLKNLECEIAWYKGHLVNQSDKMIKGALCFDLFDDDKNRVATCGGPVDLKAKEGFPKWSTRIGMCVCDKGTNFRVRFLKNGDKNALGSEWDCAY